MILCYSNGFITIFDEEKNHGKISGLVTKNVIMVSDQVSIGQTQIKTA